MAVSCRVHLLRLIYVCGAVKCPAGWIEMRQAASIQGDLGRSPVSACRPRPWWTCSHGEVIHDVTAVSCRWRTDRGPKRAWLSFPVSFFFSFMHVFALTPKCAGSRTQKKLFLLLSGLLYDWMFTWLLGVFFFRLDESQRIAAGQHVMFCFSLGFLKWRWCLISFWFISTLLTETGNLAHWNFLVQYAIFRQTLCFQFHSTSLENALYYHPGSSTNKPATTVQTVVTSLQIPRIQLWLYPTCQPTSSNPFPFTLRWFLW